MGIGSFVFMGMDIKTSENCHGKIFIFSCCGKTMIAVIINGDRLCYDWDKI